MVLSNLSTKLLLAVPVHILSNQKSKEPF